MNQQQAAALVIYLSRCVGLIPTTGQEWEILSPLIKIIEQVANGKLMMEVKPPPALRSVEKEEAK